MVRKKREQGELKELDLMAAMNLILILIPLLLTSMESVKIAVINVSTPQIGPSSTATPPDQKPDEKPLKLTIALTDRGITIFARDQVIENKDDPLGPTLPKIGSDGKKESCNGEKGGKVYDFAKLQDKLEDLKNQNTTEDKIIISAEPNIHYKCIINAMDASREKKDGDKKVKLFPNVVLSAGVA